MVQSTVIKLIAETVTLDGILQEVKTYSAREVYAQVQSIARAEWFEAGRNGLKPDISFVMRKYDYNGEKIVEWNGVRYGVYRTFLARGSRIELYCEKKGGIDGAADND